MKLDIYRVRKNGTVVVDFAKVFDRLVETSLRLKEES